MNAREQQPIVATYPTSWVAHRLRWVPITLLLSLFTLSSCATACDETIVLDSVEYNIGERWCGKKIDTTQIAEPELLVKLPDTLTYEEFRIYVTPETHEAFVLMAESALKDSIELITDSGFRSASFQRRIIRRRMEAGDSFEMIVRFVAPPGYSEHETGRALDLVPSEARFVHTKIYAWLKENAGSFGFVESIPEDKSGKTYWESWHWYYSGPE